MPEQGILDEIPVPVRAAHILKEYLLVIVVAIEVPVVVPAAIPLMVVVDMASFAIPVPCKIVSSIMTRFHPVCTRVSRTGPVSAVPLIVVSNGVPVAINP